MCKLEEALVNDAVNISNSQIYSYSVSPPECNMFVTSMNSSY